MNIYKKYLTIAVFSFISYSSHADSSIHVSDSWVNEAPPTAKILAGYMTIINQSNDRVDLISVTSPDFEAVEIHETQIVNDIVKMQKVDCIEIDAGSRFQFKPGAHHLMLINPLVLLKQGDIVRLDIVFSNNDQITLNMPVIRQTNSPEHHHHH